MNIFTLVTGASSGIGKALAYEFAKHGNSLVLVSRDMAKLGEIGNDIKNKHDVDVIVIAADLTNAESVEKVCMRLEKQDVYIENLVNNAGVGDFGEFGSASWKNISEMISLNIETLTHLTWRLLPEMVRNGKGRILNVASVASFFPGPYMAVYNATKAYVLSFSEALSEELSGSGVHVTTLCPGPTASGFFKKAKMENLKIANGGLPSAQEVAEFGYKALMANKVVAVHGFKNLMQSKMHHVLPRAAIRKMVAWVISSKNNA